MATPTAINVPHPSPEKFDDGYEEVTVLTLEDAEISGDATGAEYVYYEEVTVADDEDVTYVTYLSDDDDGNPAGGPAAADRRDEGRAENNRHDSGPQRLEDRATAASSANNEGVDDDEFTRMDESVMFHRAWLGREGPLPAQLGRNLSTSSSAAFSYAHVGRRYEFVQLLEDDDDDDDDDDGDRIDGQGNGNRRQRLDRGCSEWQTLASQTLFVEEDETQGDDEGQEIPIVAAPTAPVSRDIYWEPPLTSVGWKWCRAGGASEAPKGRRDRPRCLGLALLFRGRRRDGRQGSCQDEPQFVRRYVQNN